MTEADCTATEEADVIVIGAGNAGCAAAASCVDNGLSVIVLEKLGTVQGRGGGIGLCNTKFTKAYGEKIGQDLTVNVDEALSVNKYEVDEETPHIELAEDDGSEAYSEEFLKLVRVCPAALYKVDGDGAKSFDYAGCLECGTCRIACEGTIVKKWVNPGPTMGVEYRLG